MVIDTCIFIEHLRAKDRAKSILATLFTNEPIYVSAVTVFELYSGATTPQKRQDVAAVTEDLTLLPFDAAVAAKAGDIYQTLKKQNKLIGVADIMIAATCLTFDQPILTSNKKHFKQVESLNVLP
ncbi:type II toxin-antitoxin system VapC family toxin [Inquilinus sp. KBS0705]|nr:type II toxin-antitoxin system VapC family toxin [Inquilinus sp. KBS0705]